MKTPSFVEQLCNRPVLIQADRLQHLLSQVSMRAEVIGKALDTLPRRAQGPDDDGNNDLEEALSDYLPNNRVKYSVKNGIATVPVQGVITRMTSRVERMFYGLCDIDMVASDLQRAAADPSAKVIKMAMNSPGGGCAQVPEVASLISQITRQKPVVACIDELCASAGIWLATSASAVCATPSAEVGSIGVYIAFMDLSAYYASLGIKMDIIKAGALKGTGYPGTSLTTEQRTHLQAQVDECYAAFTRHIKQSRGPVPTEAMQGQTFSAEQARGFKLVDRIYPSVASMDDDLERHGA